MTSAPRQDDWIDVLAPGALSCVQDLGRDGWRHLGVGRGGALDPRCAILANALVGNPPAAAVLELALHGPTLRLRAPARVALLGAACELRFDGQPLPAARPLDLPAGTLSIGGMRSGVRAWLAVAGGLAVAPVLGSRGTDLRGGFGGLDGRALRAGDRVPLGPRRAERIDAPRAPGWWIDPDFGEDPHAPIRYVPTRAPALSETALRFGDSGWKVEAASNRQGLRLSGDALDAGTAAGGRVSEPVAPGTIQLPADGGPIVLLADAQTVGGYPRLGHVIAADLPRLAQARPNTKLYFRACDENEARAARVAAAAELARLRWAIADRVGAA
ncbi:biotin-dependent carboxyltransferase family protein [Lysobacter sp. K5869]|uniref:5-oxoprolinase subunit C family protein n=1 Tax=Lysobacter sp. K5869 TaxID=2820808 RepID=UPI001C05FA2C|nr:biotin-dependent carboxyltransferase family protein [Lysobacter sp. K5869]QWP74831.1 biotin-dependent carboxyltransferase family protein [Lysobacter sp. K5869]